MLILAECQELSHAGTVMSIPDFSGNQAPT
jgi:hypothetical protein